VGGERLPGVSRRTGGVLSQRFPDCLAQSDPRLLPVPPAIQHALYVLCRVSFETTHSTPESLSSLTQAVTTPARSSSSDGADT
jgi:hypothetical protein